MRPLLLASVTTLLLGFPSGPVALSAQVTVAPDTLAQIRAGGDTLQVVQWATSISPRAQRVMVHNRTEQPLVIQAYTIADCAGILLRQCGEHPVKLRLLPNQTLPLTEIATRRDIRGGFRYRVAVTVAN